MIRARQRTKYMSKSATDVLENIAKGKKESGIDVVVPQYPFLKAIILDVISDPNVCKSEDYKTYWHSMGITNMQYASVLPRNTIIGKIVESSLSPLFFFPFFSHIYFPCKAGEMIWVTADLASGTAYWISKVTQIHTVDDTNHTHPGRVFEPSTRLTTKDLVNKEIDPNANEAWNELRNSRPVYKGKNRTSSTNQILKGEDELIFESLTTESNAAENTVYESVPRYKKRPADIALEGSNNTLIVLGTDRVGGLEIEWDQKSGAIDIVSGRGCTTETAGTTIQTTSIASADGDIKGLPIKSEIDKSLENMSPQEGDPDLIHDRSRVLISQRTSVDKNFEIDQYTSKVGITESANADAAAVMKSDKVRIISRSDVHILVKGYDLGEDGDQKNESSDTSRWVSITLNTAGDIIIKPSKSGFIKLGDETANKAILCTDSPAIIEDGNVSKKTGALSNTMGGKFGGTGIAGQGTWASKVLVTLCQELCIA